MPTYDLIIRSGMIMDGSGRLPYMGDVAVQGDTIAAVGQVDGSASREIDAQGAAIAPGFINMLSWAVESLIEDGRSQSDIRQGVTLEVMGEAVSMGPLSEAMKAAGTRGLLGNEDIQYTIEWTTLGEYLEYLERRGVSCNVASFVGSSTLRIYAVGYDDRPPTPEEQNLMRRLTRQAMEEGAVGLSTALIYPPASYAHTDEIIDLAKVVAEYGGLYISHLRSEGDTFFEAFDEFMQIIQTAGLRGEIYHLKAAGHHNWHKMDEIIRRMETARAAGVPVTADMYPYPAGGTGLNSVIPSWVHDGGSEKLLERLKDPELRARIKAEMNQPSTEWENMYYGAKSPDNILLAGFTTEALKPLTGKTLAEVARLRGTSPEDTAMDLLIEDGGRIFTMYFTISEDNIRKQIALPWVSFCSDAASLAPEGIFLKSNPHPRAYGAFARVLAKYVREEKRLTVQDAVRRLSALPASVLKLDRRGSLTPGCYADIVVFDPDTIQDHATFTEPHRYATGVRYVLVNGAVVIEAGDHTGAKPGRVVRGPGWKNSR